MKLRQVAKSVAAQRLRLMVVDIAMATAYGESIYDEGYDWLREAIANVTSMEEVKAVLTDANFHSAVDALP